MDWYERRQLKERDGFTGTTYIVTFYCGDWDDKQRRVVGAVGTMHGMVDEFDGFHEAYEHAERSLLGAIRPYEHFGEVFEAVKANVGEVTWEKGCIKSNESVAEVVYADAGRSFPFRMCWMSR